MKKMDQNPVKEKPRTQPIRSVAVIVPLTGLLPTVSPIQDLLASMQALERGERVYRRLSVLALVILTGGIMVGFIGYFSAF
jgi:hypothetical protein